jgi:hypothetical protein
MAEVLSNNYTEPIVGIWNRLEPRPTKHSFSRVLSAETYDALWMLNRQWQFGEFKGEDTGSAVFSQMKLRNTKISRYASGNSNFDSVNIEVLNDDIPLEAKVEAEQLDFDLKTHLQISVYWKRLLQSTFGSNATLYTDLLNAFQANYTLAVPVFANDEEEANHEIHKRAAVLRTTARGKWLLDGEQLYEDLKIQVQNGQAVDQLLVSSALVLSLLESNNLDQIASSLIQWFEELWVQPLTDSSWAGNRLEYQFANTVPRELPILPQHTLLANEYYHGKLDWYAYDVDTTVTPLNNAALLPDETPQSEVFTRTMFPTHARFQGMPVPRWWQFEEGSIDFGKIYGNTNDISHILLAQFGLVYSNDWQIVPFKIPVGSLSEVEKLMITDVFGQKTIVLSANQPVVTSEGTVDSDWDYWAMFNLSHTDASNNIVPDGRLLFPPTVHKIMESKPVEEVLFARDEVSNVVWAIERTIAGPMGTGVDWDALSRDRKQFIIDKIGTGFSLVQPPEAANFSYEYVTENIPENWIPFVARNRVAENTMVLQRGIMQRNFLGVSSAIENIRPAGKMLRENTNGNVYFLYNEEVPKAGILVSRSYQRARWHNGKVVNWMGRRKTAALGQLHNQLEFDKTTNFNTLDIE